MQTDELRTIGEKMTRFPASEAKVAYDQLTFRSTVQVLKAATQLDWDEFWMRVRDEDIMANVAQAMLRAAASELRHVQVASGVQEVARAEPAGANASKKLVLVSEATKKV